jgi:Ca2+:H+ antiporter
VSRLYVLAVFIPVAIVLDIADADAAAIFFTAALGIVPTAMLMSDATEALAARSGPGIGGLLNVTFGNAPELIIAFFALEKGLQEVVKASLVGSVIGNCLLVLGAAMLAGGFKNGDQTFKREVAHAHSATLMLAVIALILPAVLVLVNGDGLPRVGAERVDFGNDVEKLSLYVAIILMLSYVSGLFFSLRTHRDLFNPVEESGEDHTAPDWSTRRSVITLAIAGIFVGLMSEVLVGSIEEASHAVGLSQFFIGVFVVAIVGNAAEHWVAVVVAMKNKMTLAVNIAVGSSSQIALFVAPLLVLLSFGFGPHPMALVFNGYEIAAFIGAVLIANFVTQEGESTWFEGVQLLSVYAALGFLFYFA